VKTKPVVTRRLADDDTDSAFDFYLAESSVETAISFINELERAYVHIARHPLTGSTRYGDELSIAGIRHWRLNRFPFLIVYIDTGHRIEVWRILHRQMDIPKHLADAD
jgi:toxin ParE1/3/4